MLFWAPFRADLYNQMLIHLISDEAESTIKRVINMGTEMQLGFGFNKSAPSTLWK